MSCLKGSEKINEEGAIETKVETVDERSPPGQSEEPRNEKTTVVHLTRKQGDDSQGRGVLGSAAAAVANTLRSAKDAIFGKGKERNDD